MFDPSKVITVSELNGYVKRVLNQDDFLREVLVRGEIANLRDYGGHLYFSLKDEKASVKAVMWRSERSRLKFIPEEGMEVVAYGSVSVFERDGVYQVYVSYMEPSGLGAMYAALEQLKKKLEQEGLFSPERKRKLPFFPRKIGVVTSIRGAAIKDILSVGRRRYRGVQFVVADAKVQGEGAPEEIARGIEVLNQVPGVDVVIVGRGGGSQEDLFVFNAEVVARAIAASRVPVVSAVGHERDVTVADLVADVRAPTPSAAAELVVPNAYELLDDVRLLLRRSESAVSKTLDLSREKLFNLTSRPCLQKPDWFLDSAREHLVDLEKDLHDIMSVRMERWRSVFCALAEKLNALSPLQVLARGFSLARKLPGGEVVRDYREAPVGTRIRVVLHRGELECSVDESIAPEDGSDERRNR